jgi:hypothetical protein
MFLVFLGEFFYENNDNIVFADTNPTTIKSIDTPQAIKEKIGQFSLLYTIVGYTPIKAGSDQLNDVVVHREGTLNGQPIYYVVYQKNSYSSLSAVPFQNITSNTLYPSTEPNPPLGGVYSIIVEKMEQTSEAEYKEGNVGANFVVGYQYSFDFYTMVSNSKAVFSNITCLTTPPISGVKNMKLVRMVRLRENKHIKIFYNTDGTIGYTITTFYTFGPAYFDYVEV